MGALFGTDGVRGLANRDITAEMAVDLAVAAAHVAVLESGVDRGGRRPCAVVGQDSRASGDFLGAATAAGLASAGLDVVMAGTLPTPGLAFLTASMDDVDLGVMLSASHNPMQDNGIKFFAHGGYKLPDDVEAAVEARLGEPWSRPVGADVGRIRSDPAMRLSYIEHLERTSETRFDGLRIVVDCANGAASEVAPEVLRRLGARVLPIAARPDGLNINDGVGSTHPELLARTVTDRNADLGLAFDGDADRCLAVDAGGNLVDGDRIMGILAITMKDHGLLAHDTLVTTVMSNLGLHLAMHEHGIATVQTAVGDRYVLEEMVRGGYNLGGEQSGHVIMSRFATTGDGILTAIQLCGQVAWTGRPLADLAAMIPQLPQVLINVPGVDRTRVATDPGVAEAVARAQGELGETGRVVLRPSGTEPLVRIMVEAGATEQAERIARTLTEVVTRHLALPASV